MRKSLIIMPKYELMYIVASSISDDQIPSVTDGILKLIADNGGTVLKEEKLGKKKLAYPIAKTRNGFYELVNFEFPAKELNALSTKVQNSEGVIRHIIVNIEEQLERAEKDLAAQEKMNRHRAEKAQGRPIPADNGVMAKPVEAITDENLDAKIEEALREDLKNV